MKNISIQKEFGWCNVHTLTNVLRDKDFKEYLSNDEYKSGDIDSVIELLQNTGYSDWSMRELISIPEAYPSIPNSYLKSIFEFNVEFKSENIKVDYPIIPYFLTVKLKSKYWHSVALINCNGTYLYIDPYIEDVVRLKSVDDVFGYFNECTGVDRITTETKTIPMFVVLNGSELGFDEILSK
jgi:hypothetical protein